MSSGSGSTQHLVPAFSPDAEFELFLNEPFVSFSPDGDRMIFSQYRDRVSDTTGLEASNPGNSSVEIMAVDGTNQRTLFHREGVSAFAPVWSPAGDEIALSFGPYFRRAGLPPARIAVIDPEGADLRLVVDDEVNNGFPSWSPAGERLVFKGGRRLFVIPASGGARTALTGPDYYSNFPEWSPDGSRIMFTSNRGGDFDLYTVRPDGTDLQQLTHATGNDAHSTWCAGGDWVVFSSARMGFKDEMALYDSVPQPYGEIFAMRADGTDPAPAHRQQVGGLGRRLRARPGRRAPIVPGGCPRSFGSRRSRVCVRLRAGPPPKPNSAMARTAAPNTRSVGFREQFAGDAHGGVGGRRAAVDRLLEDDLLQIAGREPAFRQRRPDVDPELVPLLEGQQGADHQHPPGPLVEAGAGPDLFPRHSG